MFWLVAAILAAVPISTIINYLYPITARRIWITAMESIRVAGLWIIYDVIGSLPPIVFILGVLSIFVLIGLGILLSIINWLRAVFA